MTKFLATTPGYFGDILWTLPTVKALSHMVGEPFDFCLQPPYLGLVPLLESQSYIAKVYAEAEWEFTKVEHSPFFPSSHKECVGKEKCSLDYERCGHLGYYRGVETEDSLPILDYTANKQGITLQAPIPFIEVTGGDRQDLVAYAFNSRFKDFKDAFIQRLRSACTSVRFLDVSSLQWLSAARIIKEAVCFVGCRSANYVLAHGIGQRVICYEPDPYLNGRLRSGKTYSCPYGEEYLISPSEEVYFKETTTVGSIEYYHSALWAGVDRAVEQAGKLIREWKIPK